MTQTGMQDTFIPKEWAEANGTTPDAVDGYLALQTLNKVFAVSYTHLLGRENCICGSNKVGKQLYSTLHYAASTG